MYVSRGDGAFALGHADLVQPTHEVAGRIEPVDVGLLVICDAEATFLIGKSAQAERELALRPRSERRINNFETMLDAANIKGLDDIVLDRHAADGGFDQANVRTHPACADRQQLKPPRCEYPSQAYYHDTFGEYVLPYEAVRTAKDPDGVLMSFLISTYEAAANNAKWDRKALETAIGVPGKPRAL